MPFFDGWEEFYKIFIVIEGKGWGNMEVLEDYTGKLQ